MNTRCKAYCSEVTKVSTSKSTGFEFSYNAKFYAVSSGSDENKQFFASTPSMSIEVRTYREDTFVPGKEYYVDFSEV